MARISNAKIAEMYKTYKQDLYTWGRNNEEVYHNIQKFPSSIYDHFAKYGSLKKLFDEHKGKLGLKALHDLEYMISEKTDLEIKAPKPKSPPKPDINPMAFVFLRGFLTQRPREIEATKQFKKKR